MHQPPPEFQLLRLANAFQLSRAVQVAARLKLGRLLDSGPRTAQELASLTQTDDRMLLRLLRFLAELGVVTESESGFGPTPLSKRLHLVDNIAQGEEVWDVWGALPQALRSGRSPFADVHGTSFYEYAAQHPEQSANWNEWNTLVSLPFFPVVASALNLKGDETIVDVGGGEGAGLAAILRRYPNVRGVLFDLPQALIGAPELLDAAEIADRVTLVAGNALQQIPTGGDVYLVSRVLQNLDDSNARQLLTCCCQALETEDRLILIEKILPELGAPERRSLAASDLNHFLLWGGGHRTRSELQDLLAETGLDLIQIESLPDQATEWQRIEARRQTA